MVNITGARLRYALSNQVGLTCNESHSFSLSGTAQLANCISLKQTPSVWIRNQLGNEWECMFHMFPPSILPKLNIYNIVLKEGNYAGATVFITSSPVGLQRWLIVFKRHCNFNEFPWNSVGL